MTMTNRNSQQNCPEGIDPEIFHNMIAKCAYYKAEARNFAAGAEEEDWFEAEQEIKKQCYYWTQPAE
jgi:DUF2934 family protein